MFRGKFSSILLACAFFASSAQAYTLTQTQSGQAIRWHYGQKFFLAGNTNNSSGLSPTTIWNAVVNGLQQWKRATQGMFDFDYWQGTNPAVYQTRQEQNGLNSIFFASQSSQKTDPNVIGFTQVWFNANSGDMIEADIILNDRDYILTDTPTDTSSHQEGGKRVYLNNVITHEIGHALGLSHSNSINSTMLYVEFSEQFKLGCDDWTAAKHLYPTSNNGMGSLTGVIISPDQEPVAGAVVTAISIARGIPVASVLTDQSGKFNFGALEEGNVSLLVEPYQGTPSSIPMKMRARTEASVCDGAQYPKNFITEDDEHSLKKFKVNVGKNSFAGTLQLKCAEVKEAPLELAANSPDVIVDTGEIGSTKSYTFNASGSFRITGLGYLLLSPIKVALSVFDAAGNPIAPEKKDTLYRSKMSNYKIEDGVITGTAFGPVTVKVEISATESSSFPTPAVQPSTSPYFVLIYNGEPDSKVSSSIPNNARCESTEAFPDYQSPPGGPIRDSTASSSRDHIGFCGNAEAASFYEGKRQGSHPMPTPGSLLGWGMPFLVAIACQLFLRKRRAKLDA